MRRCTDILFCPLGEHDNSLAVRNLAKLVEGSTARFTLLGVVPAPKGLRQLLPRPEAERELRAQQRARLEHDLATWAHRVGRGPDVETVVEEGSPADVVLDRVARFGHDLVVVTTDDDRDDRATIRRLMRDCPCPVWVIRPTRARTLRVLAALDPDPEQAELNRRILELAASMVELAGGELHVVHAWELFGESTLRSPAFVHASNEEIDELLRREHDARQHAIEQLLAQPTVARAPWRVHLVKGSPVDEVPRLAAALRTNLLVMGTVARGGLAGLVMGNTAESILDRVGCSVIAVKPCGADSPAPDASRS